MQNDVATTIQCSNETCKANNNDTDKYCQQCGMPINKRYLWAVGEGISALEIGDMVRSRYLLLGDRIFLDTKPNDSPEIRSPEITYDIKPYLRLVPYRLQIPQVYGFLPLNQEPEERKILLLEDAAIYSTAEIAGQLMPQLIESWQDATSLRQLHWLWQIAELWQPLSAEGVASSLLDHQLIRVEQSIVHLLQLQLDVAGMPPTLSQLGELWHQLIPGAKPAISNYLERICYGLITSELSQPDDLITSLEKALTECGKSLDYTITTSTLSDKGPSRQRNEDACFPPSGTTTTTEKSASVASTLTIVCDGIGGHEGGNVASNLAIETVQEQIEQLKLVDTNELGQSIIGALEKATHAANDRISDRNDSEYRQGRQRMGTTLVMALAHQQQMYITHVGDSRAYLVTRTGCHQVTLDDDVAAREVRLGYSLYSTALLQPSSGSLIQALGMNLALHPTVSQFILDEDCVFLLCSDGLSDYDRVEQHWETEILPILEGKIGVVDATARLIEIANTHNGHDNVTVGVLYHKGSFSEPQSQLSSSLALPAHVPPDEVIVIASEPSETPEPIVESLADTPTEFITTKPKKSFPTAILLGLFFLLSLGGLAYLFRQPINSLLKPEVSSSPVINSSPNIISTEQQPEIASKSVFQIKTSPGVPVSQVNKLLLRQEPATTTSKALAGAISPGNIVQVVDKTTLDRQKWLLIKVCASPTQVANLSGWIPETELASAIEQAPSSTCFVPATPGGISANESPLDLPR
jgi:protein phosphatase